ncbi:T9SS type B sorting domain-containing protein [Aquimarina gracilis]|uniref:T9SS type B sorting domain-containing protein n=1 Tax=Aquimarina gracilis TaxID=874422 RepID=A0ABU5ZQE7_9FLAO|nr:T9SS type B sorting domain-containing protein [Aquimarina gracilis]MEB3344149.1 T9SS type B sorting domain-containing protein [Aquimarina gracilis]
MRIYLLFFLVLFGLFFQESNAQLGFCGGNYGDAIFTEDFGTGVPNGPALPAGTTTYTYVNGPPDDGEYTLSSTTNYFDWHDVNDRTPGDTNGKSFIVNASFTVGEFFRQTITGLCENTSYEFSSWLINLLPVSSCSRNGIPVNVGFEIWDSTDTRLLASGNTGDIHGTASPVWEQYALVFQTLPGQTSVILKMLNNGGGGCGNDLAIDDIIFRACGDRIMLADTFNNTNILSACEENAPLSVELTANPDFSVYSTHAYQWQESMDGVTWIDIVGETNSTYIFSPIFGTTSYRVKVAEDPINLSNPKCNALSDVFEVIIEGKPNAPTSMGDVSLCADNPGGVLVSVSKGITANWYDAPVGGNLLQAESPFYETKISGTYYAEAVTKIPGCFSDTRTAVSITYFDLPVVEDESLTFCEGQSISLSAGITNASYLWDTGETTKEIVVASPGTYTVVVTNGNGCSGTKTIQLSQIDNPVIDRVVSDHRDLTILTLNSGDFEYSLNGLIYQETPFFENLRGGAYNAFVRSRSGCDEVQLRFIHLVIPRFFTPNGDGINDGFSLEGAEFVDFFKISIFDRASRLLFQSTAKNFSWDGMFNNRLLPSSSYWYRIEIEQNVVKGYFTLIR